MALPVLVTPYTPQKAVPCQAAGGKRYQVKPYLQGDGHIAHYCAGDGGLWPHDSVIPSTAWTSTSWRSATSPRCATRKIGACGSVLIATIYRAPARPSRW